MTMPYEVGPAQRRPADSVTELTRALVAGTCLLLTAGCMMGGGDVERRIEPTALPEPITTQIPLTVGVFYSLEFRLARPVVTDRLTEMRSLWNIGDPSVELFNSLLPRVFNKVIDVETWPTQSSVPKVAGIIIPRVSEVVASTDRLSLTYGVEIYSLQGNRLAGWEVAGRWTGTTLLVSTRSEKMQTALRSAGAALIASFYRDPAARKWLSDNGVSPDTLQ